MQMMSEINISNPWFMHMHTPLPLRSVPLQAVLPAHRPRPASAPHADRVGRQRGGRRSEDGAALDAGAPCRDRDVGPAGRPSAGRDAACAAYGGARVDRLGMTRRQFQAG